MYHSEKRKENRIFTDAQIENFAAFGDTLQRIHDRLVDEGYFLDPRKRVWDIFKVGTRLCTCEEQELEN